MHRTVAVCLATACAPQVEVAVRGQPPTDVEAEAAWALAIDDITVWRAQQGVSGVAVAVVVDGRTRFAEGFGLAGEDPVHAGTTFRWASVSKPIVATAVLQAEQEGLLSLADPLSSWLPEVPLEGPFADEEPLLGDLLDHRSGLADRLVWRCDVDDDWLQDSFVEAPQLPLLAPAGAFYNYSNSGYSALGAVLERAHDRPFVDLIAREVLAPLGLRGATFEAEEAEEAGGSPGLGGDGAQVMPLDTWDCASARPAAWLHGSVRDLARFVEQLDEGPLAPQMEHTVDTHWRADGTHRAGPGLFSVRYRDAHDQWLHDGWVTGFSSEIVWLPEERLGVVIVANRGPVDVSALRRTLVDRFLGYDPDEPRSEPHTPTHRPELVGRYEQPVEGYAPTWATGELEVLDIDSALWLTTANPALGRFELVQTDGDAYVVGVGGVVTTLRFLEHEGERYLVNRAFVARRL